MLSKEVMDGGIIIFEALLSKEFVSGSSIVVGILIAFTEFMQWPILLNYIFAFIVFIFGILWLLKK